MRVNPDNTVSFRYCGPAKRISVQGDFFYADQDSTRYTDKSRKIRMHRESDGCFHATTRPLQPETYTYCFRINGKRKPDPLNNDTSWQKIHKWNVVTVGGTPQSDLYQQPERQGKVYRLRWYSKTEGLYRRVNIYTPAAYDTQPADSFPVLYLLHGINGYEGSWTERGRAIQILEHLIAEGQCRPTVLVMPDVNLDPRDDRPSHHTLGRNMLNYSRLCHAKEIERAVMELPAMVDSLFRISKAQNDHAIAGLSDGARMAADIANQMPGYFATVGMFSPVVHKKQLPKDSIEVFVYTGTRDIFHPNAKRFHRRLQKMSATEYYIETSGGHDWRSWRLHLTHFLKRVRWDN